MKKLILFAVALSFSAMAFCQTPAGSFQCNMKNSRGMSQADINTFISRIDFENYRLLDLRTTLSFDNGFDIIMLSAREAKAQGLIRDIAAYQASFSPTFRLPVFHITADGKVSASYPVINSKYSTEKR
jgi:hypothetical protein